MVTGTTTQPIDHAMETARAICSQVKRLESIHRAGLTPSYGQLQDLFETRDLLERQIDSLGRAGATSPPVAEARDLLRRLEGLLIPKGTAAVAAGESC